jgi:hypothetical protein
MKFLLPLVLAAVVLLPGATAHAQGSSVTTLDRMTPVREYDGRLLFSRWDGRAYHLSVWHEGTATDLDVPTQARAFDADIGTDANGRPSVVVSLCDRDCDLYVSGLEPGDRPRRARGVNTGAHDEVAPSIWGGSIAFGREVNRNRVDMYEKGPRSRLRRLPGLGATRCGAVEPPSCRPVENVDLEATERTGRWIAQSWNYQPDDFGGHAQNEIRLTDRSGTRDLRIASMTTGEGGQTYLGLSIARGDVAFFKGCQGDPSGCSTRNSGALRYDISTRRYQIAGANEDWTGWAWDGESDYHVPSAFDCTGGDSGAPPSEACAIYRRDDLTWSSIRAARVR